ncbi:MAG: hypothetical protein MRJ96_09420 [Nitrospirales bacterium]|nr:hypothetical protein [Nitrospira sp.]MDR4501653.1 hypothetical protein [Nitrospirales bacterium]
MEKDITSLNRIKTFMEFLQRASSAGVKPTFVNTPTEHGDNINAVVTIDGKKENIGLLFWDVNFLQNQGLVDTLDEEEIALGMNVTDGMIEDCEKILSFVHAELSKLPDN